MPKAQLIAMMKAEIATANKQLRQLEEDYKKDREVLTEEIAFLTRTVNFMSGNPHADVSIHEYENAEPPKKKYDYKPIIGEEPKEGSKKATVLNAIRQHGPINSKDLSMLLDDYPRNALSGQMSMLSMQKLIIPGPRSGTWMAATASEIEAAMHNGNGNGKGNGHHKEAPEFDFVAASSGD